MPALLEATKPVSKQEEFVEKQIEHARKRIRTLDWFVAALAALIGSLAFLFAILLIDRSVETPGWAGLAALGGYLAAVGGFLYWTLFRPSRRQINPFYAARAVEQTIPDAKNSVINYVDLKDDDKVPGSMKTAIGIRAAKDLKQVDLNQAIHKRQILWMAGLAGFFFLAAVVAAILPPTRTKLALLNPKGGDATIIQGEDFRVEAEIKGRIPTRNEPDAPRLRLWYNPDDPTAYEDRALEQVEGQKRLFGVTIPAKQVRTGFRYKVMAGNVATADFEVKVHIIPQFTGWNVEYEYPDYLGREPSKTENPNLVGYFNTMVTVTAFTNRPVKSGVVEIEKQVETIPGQLVPDNPEAIRFRFPMLRGGHYRIRFIATEDRPNPEPQRYSMALVDPKPIFLHQFDVTYDYPRYLGAAPDTMQVPQPNLEAMRGTKVTLLARANRPVKDATLQFPGRKDSIAGELDPKKPMEVKFVLPPLLEDGSYHLQFTPKTHEGPSSPESFTIRVITDQPPKVHIDKPEQAEIELPANGILPVEGIASDDIGLARINLRMEVVSEKPARMLLPKAYRDGMSFRRESDNTYPTQLAYKDFVELAKVKLEDTTPFALQPGMVIEYWLEAIDNCDVPPGPNVGLSQKQKVKIVAPVANDNPRLKKDRNELQQAQQQHEQKQDQNNKTEQRQSNQPGRKGDKPQQQKGDGTQGAQQQQNPNPMPADGMEDSVPPMNGQQGGAANQEQTKKDRQKVEEALNQGQPMEGDPGAGKQDMPAKTDNVAKSPNKNPKTNEPQPAKNQDTTPKNGAGGDMRQPTPNDLQQPDNFEDLAKKLQSPDQDDREQARQQLKEMMEQAKKNPPKREEQQKKIDEHRNKLDKQDQEKFDRAMDDIQKEMQQLQRNEQAQRAQEKANSNDEKTRQEGQKEMDKLQREERVQKAAEKAMSNDQKTREEGQKDLEKELQNQNTRDDVDQQLQNLANGMKDKTRQRKLDEARNLAHENQTKQNSGTEPPPPKKEENDVDRLVKKIEKGKPEEKKAAEEELQKKLQDKEQREQVQKQLDDIKNNIKDEQARQNFEKSMQKIKDNVAKNDAASQQPAPKPEDIEKFADKLTSDNKQERDQAQEQLKESMKQADKDPQANAEARKKIDDVRSKITDKNKQEQFDQAMQKIDKAVQQERKNQDAKARQQRQDQAQQVAKDLQSGDQQKQQAAKEKLKEMLQDPKSSPAMKDALDKEKQTAGPKGKQDLDNAQRQAEEQIAKDKGNGGQSSKKDDVAKNIEKFADKLTSDNKQERDQAQEQLKEAMKQADKDPKANAEARKKIDEARSKIMDKNKQEQFDQAMGKIDQAVQQERKDQDAKAQQQRQDQAQQVAKDLQSGDKQKQQAAQEKLKEMLQDPKSSPAMKDALDKEKQTAGPKGKQDLDNAQRQAEEQIAKDKGNGGQSSKNQDAKAQQQRQDQAQQVAKDLQSGDQQKQQAAQDKLKEMLQDPKSSPAMKDALDKEKQTAGPKGKQDLDNAQRQAEEQIAKDKGNGGQSSKKDDVAKNIEKFADKLTSDNKQERDQAQEQLKEAMKQADKDPKANAEARKKIDEARSKIMDKNKQEQFDQAMQKIDKAVQQERKDQDAKAQQQRQEQAQQVAKDLQSGDKQKEQAAQEKLKEMLQDPKNRQAMKDELAKQKQTADPKNKQGLENAERRAEEQIAKMKGAGEKPFTKEDVDKLADKLANGSPDEKKNAQQQLEKMMQDPAQREQVMKDIKKFEKSLADEQKKDFKNAMQQMKDNVAQHDQFKKLQDGLKGVPPPLRKPQPFPGSAEAKQLEEMMKDPEKRKQLEKAAEDYAKKEVDKIVDKMQNGSPDDKQQAQQQLENLLKSADQDLVKKQLEQFGKNLKDDQARKDFDKKRKEMEDNLAKKDDNAKTGEHDWNGENKKGREATTTDREAGAGATADLKNKLKAGELLLEKFKKKMTDEEFKKSLGLTDERMKALQRQYEREAAELRKKLELAEKGELPPPRVVGPSVLDKQGAVKVSLEPKNSGTTSAGSKFTAPPGFNDPYRRFTEEVSGSVRPAPLK